MRNLHTKCNSNYNLPKPISSQDKCFIDVLFSSFGTITLPQNSWKEYNKAESRKLTLFCGASGRVHGCQLGRPV